MKLVLDERIIREVIDTLYMARTTLLGITGLDSPQEVAKKSANETAITRRISKAIDIIQQGQPETDGDDGKFVRILVRKELAELFQKLGDEIQAGQSSFIRTMNQQEQPEVDLEKELISYHNEHFSPCENDVLFSERTGRELDYSDYEEIARHFAEWGAEHARKED